MSYRGCRAGARRGLAPSVPAVVALTLVLPAIGYGASVDHPTLRRWLSTTEPFDILAAVEISLVGGEEAVLVDAFFPERGRCCSSVAILARPRLERAQEVDVIASNPSVMDLDRDGVSDVEAHGGHMGQGYVMERWQIYSFDGWEPVIRYDTEPLVVSNEGSECGHSADIPCESSEVSLEYTDLDNDGRLDLIATVRTTKWLLDRQEKKMDERSETVVTRYLFKNGKFSETKR